MSRRQQRLSRERELEAEPRVDPMENLASLLGRLLADSRPVRRQEFKAPEFSGTGDLNYFWKRFQEVALANEWGREATILHLRASLKDSAQECGKGDTIEEIKAALQARFGLSVREARAKLSALKRSYQTTLAEHAAEVEKLVNVAYEDIPVQPRKRLALDAFQNSLGDTYLQRHLLAVNADTLEAAVQAGAEYLLIKNNNGGGAGVRMVEEDVQPSNIQATRSSQDPLQLVTEALQKLSSRLERLEEGQKQITWRPPQNPRPPPAPRSNVQCWNCGQLGHTQRVCSKPRAVQGNDQRPQQ